MKHKKLSTLTAFSFATACALNACGGGGGDGGGAAGGGNATGAAPATPASSAATGNVTAPEYPSAGAQLAVFNTINQQRQQCGFPALTENTVLDQAAQAHALYMSQNGGLITDTEDSTKPGYTGLTYTDRAVHFGFPDAHTASSGGVSAGFYTNATLSEAQYGQNIANAWLSGVYHIAVGVWPVNEVGIGWSELTFNGFPRVVSSMTIANLQPMAGNLPMTFPCQGTSGVAYTSVGETPTAPNTSGNFGQPVAVAGNPTDVISLQSGTMTDANGNVIDLQILDSTNDPNKLLPPFEAVAYPAGPLSPNATYSVSLVGKLNGNTFSRNFTFTTSNIIG
jgi:hypothetical protein